MDGTANYNDLLARNQENFSRMTTDQLLSMVRCLHESHDLAKRFNSDNELRNFLWKAGNLTSEELIRIFCLLFTNLV